MNQNVLVFKCVMNIAAINLIRSSWLRYEMCHNLLDVMNAEKCRTEKLLEKRRDGQILQRCKTVVSRAYDKNCFMVPCGLKGTGLGASMTLYPPW